MNNLFYHITPSIITNEDIYHIFDTMMTYYHINDHIKTNNIWKHGGYWTGEKRLSSKKKLLQRWNSFLSVYQVKQKYYSLFTFFSLHLHDIIYYYQKTKYRTIIHGDFKPQNICYSNKNISIFDWQWVGYGHPITDLFYFLFHVFTPNECTYDNIMLILEQYERDIHIIHMIILDYFVYLVTCKLYSNIHVDYTIDMIHALIKIVYHIHLFF